MNTHELLATQMLHPALALTAPTSYDPLTEMIDAGNFMAYVGNTPGAIRRWHTIVESCKRSHHMDKWMAGEVERATSALTDIFDRIEEIDPREFSKEERKLVGRLADMCAEFGMQFNNV